MLSSLAALFFLIADLEQARDLLRQGRVPEALREMDAAMRNAPQDAETKYQVGELLRELAGDRAARLQELAPDSAEAKQLLGRSLEARGNVQQALEAYRAALTVNPRAPGLHFLIGNIHWRQRDFEAAKREMEAELRLNPAHPFANLRLGQILLAMDQPSLATGHLLAAVRADGSSVEAHRELGKAYRALTRYTDALREFRIVAQSLPRDASIHAQLASVYRSLGRHEDAKAEMESQSRLLRERAEAARKASPAAVP